MSEKNLPLDPSVLEPTLFDMSLSEEEQAALAAEVRKMEEQNEKAIDVKSHKREVRKPVMRKDLPVEETHIYPEGINLDEYTEIGVETTDRIATSCSDVHRPHSPTQVRAQVKPADRGSREADLHHRFAS